MTDPQVNPLAARPVENLPTLEICGRGTWFRTSTGRRVSLLRRRALRRILRALVQQRFASPDSALDAAALHSAGWPDDRTTDGTQQARRVYTALWELRKLGLGDVLLTRDDGYLLDPDVSLHRVLVRRLTQSDRPGG